MTRLRDAVVWVSGASSGIGAETARQLARQGARLVLSARGREALEQVRTGLADPDRHRLEPLDVTDHAAVLAAVSRIEAAVGPVDVVVAAAGVTQRSRVIETEHQVYRDLMDINFFGTVSMVQAVLPGMLERGLGHVVGLSSVVGKYGSPLRSGYSAAKHALQGFMDSLRAEVHDEGVRVTVVSPGFVDTGISARALTGDGSLYGKVDAKQSEGLAVEDCARGIVRAIEAETPEVYMGGLEVAGIYAQRYAPALWRRIIRRVEVR